MSFIISHKIEGSAGLLEIYGKHEVFVGLNLCHLPVTLQPPTGSFCRLILQPSERTGNQKVMKRFFGIAGSAVLCVTLAATIAAGQKSAAAKGDPAKGKETFEQCAICHNVDSPEKKMGPSLQHLFQHKTLTNGKPVNDANVLAYLHTI